MSNILTALEPLRELIKFTLELPVVKVSFAALLCPVAMVIEREVKRSDLLASLRQAIADAGLTEKAVAIDADIRPSLVSMRLAGEKPVTFDFLSSMPTAVMQFFVVRLAQRVGMPPMVEAGARLARRQARMTLAEAKGKAGVA